MVPEQEILLKDIISPEEVLARMVDSLISGYT
jgi:hypothetical protein